MESYLIKLISQYKVQSKIDFNKINTITSKHLINLENTSMKLSLPKVSIMYMSYT